MCLGGEPRKLRIRSSGTLLPQQEQGLHLQKHLNLWFLWIASIIIFKIMGVFWWMIILGLCSMVDATVGLFHKQNIEAGLQIKCNICLFCIFFLEDSPFFQFTLKWIRNLRNKKRLHSKEKYTWLLIIEISSAWDVRRAECFWDVLSWCGLVQSHIAFKVTSPLCQCRLWSLWTPLSGIADMRSKALDEYGCQAFWKQCLSFL